MTVTAKKAMEMHATYYLCVCEENGGADQTQVKLAAERVKKGIVVIPGISAEDIRARRAHLSSQTSAK